MKQLLSIILVILFAFPAWAQEGVITEIQKGQQAPFTGVLMDAKAAAKVLTEQKYTAEECRLEMDREIELLRAKLELDLKITNLCSLLVFLILCLSLFLFLNQFCLSMTI